MADAIGGFQELDDNGRKSFHPTAIDLVSGRAAFEYIVRLRHIKEIAIPNFICSAVLDTAHKLRVKVRTYELNADLTPQMDFRMSKNEFLYLVDYFGTLPEGEIQRWSALSGGKLIVDEAQAFFRRPAAKADYIYTARKFFGVPDGGYLYTHDDARLEHELPIAESLEHMHHILGRVEGAPNKYLESARANNRRFETLPLSRMSRISRLLLNNIDYERAAERRNQNFGVVDEALSSVNLLQLKGRSTPFMYPLLVADGHRLRTQLQERLIYTPQLWPNVLLDINSDLRSKDLALNLVPLPIDQRYSTDQMATMVKETLGCI